MNRPAHPLCWVARSCFCRAESRACRAVVGDLLNLFTQTQLVKIVVQEQEPVAFLAGSGSRMTNPVEQFAGDGLDLCMAIRFLLAEDMEDSSRAIFEPQQQSPSVCQCVRPAAQTGLILWG